MMTPVITDFSHCSAQDLYALFREVYSSSDAMSEDIEDKYPELADFERDMDVLQSRPGAIALVGLIDGKPVGYVTVRPRIQRRLLHTADLSMGVASTARGHGIGGQLLRAALERASASPVLEIIYLMVRADNTAAVRLYAKAGFDTLGVLERDIKTEDSYFDGVLMRKFV